MKKPLSPRPTAARHLADGVLLLALLCALALFCLNTYLGPFYYDQSPVVSYRPPGAMSPISLLPALGVCVGAGLVSLLVWSLPRLRWLAALFLVLGAGAVIWLNWRTLACGALFLWERLSVLFTDATGFPGYFDPAQALSAILTPNQLYRLTGSQEQAAMQALLAAVAALYALPLGWAAVRVRSFWLTFALTLPWLLPAFLAEISLDWPALAAVCACWAALLLSALTARGSANAAARVTLVSLPAALALILAITLLFPGEGYVQPAWAVELRDDLLALDWFDAGDGPGTGDPSAPSGGEDGGMLSPEDSVDLSAAGPRRYTGQAVLEVTGTQPGTVYLRGAVYRDYTGTAWNTLMSTQLPDSQAGAWQSWDSALLDYGTHTITITPQSASSTAYLPYQSVQILDTPISSFTTCSTLFYPDALYSYTVSYLPLEGEPAPFDRAGALGASGYREYLADYAQSQVEEQYLSLFAGDEGQGGDLSGLLQWYFQAVAELEESGEPKAGGYTGPYAQALNAAALVAQLLERNAAYSLNVSATPQGEDFVLYFLTESRQGYCVHFASAATLLLRAQGIPARYATGYTAHIPEGGGTDTVRDWDAHAWVEIFLDGYGWYPVEVTPAARQEDDPEHTPTPTPQPSRPPQVSQPPQATPQPGNEPTPERDTGGPPLAWLLLAIPLALACSAPVWLPRLLTRLVRVWWATRQKRGSNAAALALYRQFERLTRCAGKIPSRAKELAEKARFSQHTLTQGEVEELLALLSRATAQLGRTLPLPRRRWMKLFLTALGCPPPDIPT